MTITFHISDQGMIEQVSGMEALNEKTLKVRLKALQGIRAKTEREITRLIYRMANEG